MGSIAIRVESLGKLYHLGMASNTGSNYRYKRLTEVVTNVLRSPAAFVRAKRAQARAAKSPEESGDRFWALKDVSFEIKKGEAVGIIGRNGAGKSTLLKILSRITYPTTGRVALYGRVGSLLEVGTGFHPELTGRENVYLNGTILGMRKDEIARKFDEIVAFAEIEKFLDTPVKHYSSGMYVRLAFAVAAHLEPEILVVDEVLAVGDAEFQKKCLGKMGDVAREGRTVLFVSHNMDAISLLCQEAILLQKGRLAERGPSRHVVDGYLSAGAHDSAGAEWSFEDAPSGGPVKLRAVSVRGPDGLMTQSQRCGEPITLSMEFWCLQQTRVVPTFFISNWHGIMLFQTTDLQADGWAQKVYSPGLYRCSCMVPAPLLNTGKYYVHVSLSRHTDHLPYVAVPEAVSFEVHEDWTARDTSSNANFADYPGVIRTLLPWTGEHLAGLPPTNEG